jgi:hypothetical protein
VKRVGIVLLGPLVAVGLYALLRAPVTSGPSTHDAAARIERMWEARRSDAWVEVAGVVEKLLPDDRASANFMRRWPSKWNGLVTTPTVRMPSSLAARAITGAAPVPVPPPMPAVTNTM